ncbi:uncharacterized protein LOC143851619 [Tasmannia lanceolata]|uniref:uncharacterized protein LOC143851619 n=1 Tax=Tasmannia lanceolata TaxID=3420 RepID=UPI0040643086
MLVDLRRMRYKFLSRAPLFYCFSICLFSVCALLSTGSSCLDIKSLSGRKTECYIQGTEATVEKEESGKMGVWRRRSQSSWSIRRRFLSRPGSSPPRCISKCGKCTPCKPVHVPVPPGTRVTTEYYPEAWRCKCGGKLYMP